MKSMCETCGKGYEKKAYWQKYCSGSCRLAAWALRKTNKKKLTKPKEVLK